MILQTRELKQQWENASTGIVGDNRKIDLEKIEQLQKEYAISLVALITYAIKEDNFEQDNSLWSLLLNDPDFHVDVISLTLNTNNLSVTKRKNVLEKIIYVADYMEPNRDFPGVEKLRQLAFADLDQALKLGLQMTLQLLKQQGREISPESAQALAWLEQTGV